MISFLAVYCAENVVTSCSNSAACKEVTPGLCNFDYGDYGFCEHCLNIEEGACDTTAFPQEKGKEECKINCEGNRL